MSIKKKLILMGVCIVIILAVLTANVIRRMRLKEDMNPEENVLQENVITRAEAFRLLSFLDYNRTDRLTLPMEIKYKSNDLSGWYDTYVNAAAKMGLVDNNISKSPMEALSLGECKEIIDKLIMKKPELQGVYDGISFDFVNSNEDMLIPQFLELYQSILTKQPESKRKVKEEFLFVLDREISEDKKDRIVTDIGRYYYENSRDYTDYLKSENVDEVQTASRILTGDDYVAKYKNKGIKVLVCDKEIIYIKDISGEKVILRNVWIKEGKDLVVDTYINGIHAKFQALNKLSTNIEKVVGDIAIENEKVVGISVKPDLIQGKVLRTGEDFIEIEKYGKVPLDDNYRIYKIYGDLSMEMTNSILVGYETTDFVVSGGKISAALIRSGIKAENIRVLLHTTGYKDIYHQKVELTSDGDYILSYGDREIQCKGGDKIIIEPGSEYLSQGRVIIKPVSDSGKIQFLSFERSTGNPKYRGSIEVAEGEKGLLIVNELPLEEYLYAVIPSEMPTYYGIEALKVQAVCARSYAYRHLLANSLSSYGAHVDDSVSYQVYNNIEENEDSILAVKDTYGKVVKYGDEVITTYYFSTSCGHTTGIENVWANGEETAYLSGRLLSLVSDSEALSLAEEKLYTDLSKEENFRSFLQDKEYKTYDSGYNWYRWNVTIDAEDIKKNIDQKLEGRYKANSDVIKTLVKGNEKDGNAVYESIPVKSVGDIVDISVKTRKTGGIIYELVITGTENTILIQTEYNIRVLLSPVNDTVYRYDGKGVDNLTLLPSAFFVVDQEKEDGKLKSITINGGGYGHGVGMSQNGVKTMVDQGLKYEEILKYFYQGTKLGFIY